jgi:hypothetical protein
MVLFYMVMNMAEVIAWKAMVNGVTVLKRASLMMKK